MIGWIQEPIDKDKVFYDAVEFALNKNEDEDSPTAETTTTETAAEERVAQIKATHQQALAEWKAVGDDYVKCVEH